MNSSVKNHSPGYFVGYLIAMLCAFVLTACGGGGGSPGTVPNQPTPTPTQSVASLVITTSADTLSSSGAAGSEVTVTVLAKDRNNNAVSGANITLTANSGALTFVLPADSSATPGVTDASGIVTAKLSTAGVATLREITMTATSGTVTSTPKKVTVVQTNASLTLVTSSDELTNTGTVNVTVYAKDSLNNAIRGAKINLSASTGLLNVSTANGGLTGTDGSISATLTTPGDATVRDIVLQATLDASFGVSDPARRTVKVTNAVPTLQITASAGSLKSAGAAGTEVTINVLVRDAGNNVKPGVAVALSSNSGALTFTSRTTNAQGLVSEKLSIGNDPTTRSIVVTASADGVAPVQTVVSVVGTKISLNTSLSVSSTAETTMTANLVDSSGTPIINKTIVATTSNGGRIVAKASSMTDANGNVEFAYTAPATGSSDSVTVSALGESKTQTLVINRANFNITGPLDSTGKAQGNINTCYPVSVHSDDNGRNSTGAVNVTISRGAIYADAACTVVSNGQLNFGVGGNVTAFMKSATPGEVGLVATLPTNVSVRGAFKFNAPLAVTSKVTVSVDPSVIGVNREQATVRAVVRDGTTSNNLVSGALVNFTITADNSGGTLIAPSSVVTGDDGTATVTYISGTSPTGTNGVTIRATVPAVGISASTSLTVGRRSLFITAGTGNTIGSPSAQSYQVDYQVLATDAAGNAVSGANITASVLPTRFRKGVMVFGGDFWSPASSSISCPNEDINQNGILDAGEDINGNGRLEPGIPVAVTPTVQTNANGVATISLVYAKNQSYWLDVDLTITATVSGSEAKYVAAFVLPGSAADFNKKDVPPPGQASPYGTDVVGLPVPPAIPTTLPCQLPF